MFVKGDLVRFVKNYDYMTMPFEDIYEVISLKKSNDNQDMVYIKNIRIGTTHGALLSWRFKRVKSTNKNSY